MSLVPGLSSIDVTRTARLDGSRLWAAVEDTPFAFDWFFVMRWLDARSGDMPRMGYAAHPTQEAVRIGQRPSLAFASSTLAEVLAPDTAPHGRPRLYQYAFGLFGPHGALPTHLTELAYERIHNQHDTTLTSFLDIFHHRAGVLFYRAWSDAQAVTSLDRPDGGHFARYVDSLIGYRSTPAPQANSIEAHAKRHHANSLVRHVRNAEGLEKILGSYFSVAVAMEEWRFSWLAIPVAGQTRLGGPGRPDCFNTLGGDAVVGARVPSRQHAFRLRIGPMHLTAYERFLPPGSDHLRLRDWVRDYSGYEFGWDCRLILRRDSIPEPRLGSKVRLGWTTWIGQRIVAGDADDLLLDPERGSRGPGHIPQ